jgi:hypothetical protein
MNDGSLDRLVDGELSLHEQRELLGQLDDEPNGWRRLALAFIEAQAWRNEFPALAESNSQPASRRDSQASRRVHSGGPRALAAPRSRLIAIAAGLALAFGLGLIVRGPATGRVPAGGVVTPQPSPSQLSPSQLSPSRPLERELVSFGDGQTVDLPIVEAAQVSPDWVRSRPNLVPPPVRHELELSGHRIEQRRVFLPLVLENGQPAIVPIDEAEVQYVGERIIQ